MIKRCEDSARNKNARTRSTGTKSIKCEEKQSRPSRTCKADMTKKTEILLADTLAKSRIELQSRNRASEI